jgi:hypothetical protein
VTFILYKLVEKKNVNFDILHCGEYSKYLSYLKIALGSSEFNFFLNICLEYLPKYTSRNIFKLFAAFNYFS